MRWSRFVQQLTRHMPPGQVVRFLIVGAGNTLFAYGLYALLTWLLVPRMPSPYLAAMTANALGAVICITFSFVCHKWFVFRSKGDFFKEYLRAFVVYGGTALVGFLLLPLLMLLLNLCVRPATAVPYLAGAILTGGTVVVSFFGHKKFTFAQAALEEPCE